MMKLQDISSLKIAYLEQDHVRSQLMLSILKVLGTQDVLVSQMPCEILAGIDQHQVNTIIIGFNELTEEIRVLLQTFTIAGRIKGVTLNILAVTELQEDIGPEIQVIRPPLSVMGLYETLLAALHYLDPTLVDYQQSQSRVGVDGVEEYVPGRAFHSTTSQGRRRS